MSADILEYVDQKVRDSASSSTEWSILYADDWAKLRAEIVRLRGEVEFHQLDAGALRVQLDSCIERLEVQTKNALHLHAMMVDAEARAATIAPAEAKGDDIEARARRMFEEANKGANSAPWERQWEPTRAYWRNMAVAAMNTPQPADGGAVAEVIGFELGLPSLDWASLVNPLTIGTKLYTHPPAAQVQSWSGCDRCGAKTGAECFKNGCFYSERGEPTHPAGDALGAVRELLAHWRNEAAEMRAEGLATYDPEDYGGFLIERCDELEATLQHRGDSRGGEGSGGTP